MRQLVQTHPTWRQSLLMMAGVCLALVALFYQTAASMVHIWWRSETFAHGFIVLPITLFLVWRLRDELRQLTPQPTLKGLPLLVLLGFGWLLAEFASVAVVQQLAFVAMLPLVVYSLLGWQITRRILFPLCFLIFAVPMGEALIPPLMDFTANFTVTMLQSSGIPVYREGTFFEIPSGRWSVVEGCSGLRYLIATVTLGCLYAYLTYSSYLRRTVFIVASFIVPVFANGFRAYIIVMIANYSDYKLALGVDHFIYGWVWFGIVITIMFLVGSFWRQDEQSAKGETTVQSGVTRTPLLTVITVLVVALVWPAWAKISNSTASTAAVTLSAPRHPDWHKANTELTDWRPRYLGTDAELEQTYERDGIKVSLYLGYYRSQRQDAELVNSQNVLVRQKHPIWRQVDHSETQLKLNGETIDVWQGKLRATHGQNLLVYYWHWLGGHYTINPYLSKFYVARARLLGWPRDGAVIVMATDFGETTETAQATLKAFAADMVPTIRQQLDSIAGF